MSWWEFRGFWGILQRSRVAKLNKWKPDHAQRVMALDSYTGYPQSLGLYSLLEEDTHGKSPKYPSGSLGDLGNFAKIASPSKIMKGRHYPLATGVVGATGFPVKEARFAAW